MRLTIQPINASRQPDDLVYVHDIYGRRHRVRQSHLDKAGKIMLPRFNQYGYRVVGDYVLLHRDNIADKA